MANPFFVEPANPLKALLIGGEAFGQARDSRLQDELRAVQQEAGQLAASGDHQGALARLLGGGDFRGAGTVSGLLNDRAAQGHRSAQLAETARHNRAIEGQPVAVPVGGSLVSRGTGQPIFENKRSPMLDDETLDTMADQYLAGDRTVFQNLGRGAQGAENVTALRKRVMERAKAAGLTPGDITQRGIELQADTAAARTLANRSTNIEYAANTANRAIDIARERMGKVQRSQFLPIGKLQQAIATQTNSPEQAAAFAAVNTLVNEYARVVTPSGVPTEATRHHAREMLNTAMSHDAFNAVLDTMRQEITSAKAALGDTKREQREHRREATGVEGSKEKPGNVVDWRTYFGAK